MGKVKAKTSEMNERSNEADAGNGKEIGNANLLIGTTARSAAHPQSTGSKPANQEIGVPIPTSVWRNRGYLPHFDGHEAIQHVTCHLADSLPADVAKRLHDGIALLPLEKQTAEHRRRIEEWLDAGHGSCVLREPAVARMVEDAFLFFDGERYRLFAWVVMPNHAHVLFQPLPGWPVSKTVASWKKFTARKISDFLKKRAAGADGADGNEAGNANLLIGTTARSAANFQSADSKPANRETGVPISIAPVWHREYWDRYIRNSAHLRKTLDYIHQNPVSAKFVARPEEWPWSSARRISETLEAKIGMGIGIGMGMGMGTGMRTGTETETEMGTPIS